MYVLQCQNGLRKIIKKEREQPPPLREVKQQSQMGKNKGRSTTAAASSKGSRSTEVTSSKSDVASTSEPAAAEMMQKPSSSDSVQPVELQDLSKCLYTAVIVLCVWYCWWLNMLSQYDDDRGWGDTVVISSSEMLPLLHIHRRISPRNGRPAYAGIRITFGT